MFFALEFLLVREFFAGRGDLVLRLDMRRVGSGGFSVGFVCGSATKTAPDLADLQAGGKTFKVALVLVGKVDCERFDFHGVRRSSCGHGWWLQRETECDRAEIDSAENAGSISSRAVRPASLLRKSILDVGQRASATAGCNATFKLRAIPIV
jgi:hypothetical protein